MSDSILKIKIYKSVIKLPCYLEKNFHKWVNRLCQLNINVKFVNQDFLNKYYGF